ncbi:protein kinase [Rhodococcus opacus]|uniref:Serine/threonine-protein kinase PknK n=1 Tax=Rhodococcus opacus TaxID=37919 RepID=A0AAX3YSP0_RHOOP|nr:serine/threonine-protein kinase [Rhodococcus opacus]MCZ4587614.1 protein kinase [Rhodococcus opacus]WLF51391.1 protein kinase [Rhodococcus opacus]
MAEFDPLATQRDLATGITAELDAAGFVEAREIGRGGFGIVFRCRQPSLDRTVAIKVLTEEVNQDNLERFLREQHAMGRLTGHPHIAHILQVGTTGSGRPFLVMPFHPQGSLDSRIRSTGALEWGAALGVGVKVAGALETAHRIGILHRDVKPANILLSEYGEPQLSDFGIARIVGGFQTTAGSVTGTPAFTPPEVLQGEPSSPASDVYSLGATLFAAITGHAAFERRDGEQLVAQFLRITRESVPDLREAGIPDEVSAAVSHAMAPTPSDRPASAAAFGEELREAERRNNLIVDEMALPVRLGSVERAQVIGAGARPIGTRMQVSMPPVPGTRFRPSTPTRPWVSRGRLIEILRAGGPRRLTVIHGPAGYGKSTLAAQWAHELTGEGVVVAWLSVDRDDNNVVWFLAHLTEAIRRIRPQLAHELGNILEQQGDQAERYVLTTLIDEIHDRDELVALVIDDWHRITDPATLAAMAFVLENCCHHLRVIVTSRTQSGLPLSQMRVRNELTELDTAALRFTVDESRSFLVDIGGLTLSAGEITDLTQSTDGWVAALQLASLSLRTRRDDATELIGHMSGRHHALADFLAENVLDTLEPQVLEFLLATSVTERICGSLASALTGASTGQAMLEQIEHHDLFLRRIDENGEWFRYHHLFREFLRQRIERDQPGRIQDLHRAASRWFSEHAALGQAVDHAIAAGDERSAVELVESGGLDLIEHSQMATLLALVAKLPPALVATNPRLQLTIAWANISLMRLTPAVEALRLVDSALTDGALNGREAADLRAEADVAQGAVEISADRVDGVRELTAHCLAAPESLRPSVVSAAVNVASFVEIYRFDFDAARRLHEWAVPYHLRAAGPLTATYGYCLDGIAANELLDVRGAEERFRSALDVARRSGGAHSFAARFASALLGKLMYERGEVIQAERLIDEGYELGSECAVVDFMLARYVIGARIKARTGDLGSAANRLDEGMQTAARFSLSRLRAAIENERIRLGFATKPGSAPSVREQTTSPKTKLERIPQPRTGIDQIVTEIEEDSAIRLLLAEHTGTSAIRARDLAEDLVKSFEGQRRPRALLAVRLLSIECLYAVGQMEEAKNALAAIAAQCSELGLNRLVFDEAPHILAVVDAIENDRRAGEARSDWPTVPVGFLNVISRDG